MHCYKKQHCRTCLKGEALLLLLEKRSHNLHVQKAGRKTSAGNLSSPTKSGLKAFLAQSVKTITVQPGPSRSISPGRHIKAAILNHVSRRSSNDYWAPAYFNINSLEAGIEGGWEGGGREISSSRENPQRTLIKAVMFYRSHFSMPLLTALVVIKLQASRKD